MKHLLLVVLAVVASSQAAVVPRASFQDHFDDFLQLIWSHSGRPDLEAGYFQEPEFLATIDYLKSSNLFDLLAEMEALPEFNAVIDFIEEDGITIHHYINLIHEALEQGFPEPELKATSQRAKTGTTFNDYVLDMIINLPHEELHELFTQKYNEDEQFHTTIDNLRSEEFLVLWEALWENEHFLKEVETLNQNGVSLPLLLELVFSIFGEDHLQNLAPEPRHQDEGDDEEQTFEEVVEVLEGAAEEAFESDVERAQLDDDSEVLAEGNDNVHEHDHEHDHEHHHEHDHEHEHVPEDQNEDLAPEARRQIEGDDEEQVFEEVVDEVSELAAEEAFESDVERVQLGDDDLEVLAEEHDHVREPEHKFVPKWGHGYEHKHKFEPKWGHGHKHESIHKHDHDHKHPHNH